MKIVIINNQWKRGGVEVIVHYLALALSRQHQIIVITIGRKKEIVIEQGIRIYFIKPWNIFNFLDLDKYPAWLHWPWHLINLFNFTAYNSFKKILQEERPDLALTHSLLGLSFFTPKLLAKLGIKNILTVHDIQFLQPSGLLWSGQEKVIDSLAAKIYQSLIRRFLGSPTKVIFPSHWLKELFEKKGFLSQAKKIVLVNPVWLPLMAATKNHRPRPGENLSLLYVGHIMQHKGILWLVEALLDSNLTFTLTIIGGGTQVVELKNLVVGDGRFQYLGQLPFEQVIKNYQQADFTIVPSLVYESFSLATQESLVLGTPVIGANLGGIAELVSDTRNGFLYAPGSKSGLLEALERAKNADWQALSQQASQLTVLGVKEYLGQVLNTLSS